MKLTGTNLCSMCDAISNVDSSAPYISAILAEIGRMVDNCCSVIVPYCLANADLSGADVESFMDRLHLNPEFLL